MKKGSWIAILGMVPTFSAVAGWYLRYESPWFWRLTAFSFIPYAPFALVGGSIYLQYAIKRPGELEATRRSWIAIWALYVLLPWCTYSLAGWYRPASALIYLDNFSTEDTALELDGKPWLSVMKATSRQTRLPLGTYQLVARSKLDNRELDRRTITLEATNEGGLYEVTSYIYNVLGAQTYYTGEVVYGYSNSNPEKEQAIREVWFQVQVKDMFQGPPARVSVSQGEIRASRKYFLRHPRRD